MKAVCLAIVLALSSITLWAQGTSQIQGVGQDATGASLGGAEVRATQTDTSAVRTVTSAEDGTYVLSNLPIGPYRLAEIPFRATLVPMRLSWGSVRSLRNNPMPKRRLFI